MHIVPSHVSPEGEEVTVPFPVAITVRRYAPMPFRVIVDASFTVQKAIREYEREGLGSLSVWFPEEPGK